MERKVCLIVSAICFLFLVWVIGSFFEIVIKQFFDIYSYSGFNFMTILKGAIVR